MALAFLHRARRGFDLHPRQKTYATLAAGLFLAAAIFEIGRVVLNMPWRNVPPNLSHGVGILLSSLWTSAAATLLLRERRPGLLSASWFFALAGTVAFVAHGAVTRVFGSMPGLTYIAVAIVQFGLLKAAFDRGFLQTGVDAARPAESH